VAEGMLEPEDRDLVHFSPSAEELISHFQ
jgi:hypothetical protein